MYKVIKIKENNPFRAVGIDLIKGKDNYFYGIVHKNYNNGESVFNGTKKECEEYIENII